MTTVYVLLVTDAGGVTQVFGVYKSVAKARRVLKVEKAKDERDWEADPFAEGPVTFRVEPYELI